MEIIYVDITIENRSFEKEISNHYENRTNNKDFLDKILKLSMIVPL